MKPRSSVAPGSSSARWRLKDSGCTLLSSPTLMARDWHELFITGDAPPEAAPEEHEEERRGFFRRLRENMGKTRRALTSEIQATLSVDLDEEGWERLEEALIMADVGARTTAQVVERLEQEASAENLSGEELGERLAQHLAELARTG